MTRGAVCHCSQCRNQALSGIVKRSAISELSRQKSESGVRVGKGAHGARCAWHLAPRSRSPSPTVATAHAARSHEHGFANRLVCPFNRLGPTPTDFFAAPTDFCTRPTDFGATPTDFGARPTDL